MDLKNPYTNVDWLADELRISLEETERTLQVFASVQLIDPKACQKRVVRIPQMLEYLDEWTQRGLKAKNSRVAPERLLSEPRATPDQSKRKSNRREEKEEEEAEAEKREETAAASAAFLLGKTKVKAWSEIAIPPCGGPEFQSTWERIHSERPESEGLADTMERCIQACGQAAIRVPKPFYDAKRRVEAESRQASIPGADGSEGKSKFDGIPVY
ncbi:MAG TPA: hypothetical protein VNH18_32710 [Bryobacteraceae bacterium]|nr:hypothetical protein [Bryobacteraceae bacterium]